MTSAARSRRSAALAVTLALLAARAAAADDDPRAAPRSAPAGNTTKTQVAAAAGETSAGKTPLALTLAQQQAVGIRTDHPLPMSRAPQLEAYGTVLDPVNLVSDLGKLDSTRAAAAAAAADAARIAKLYHEDTQASLKALQAAQAQSAEATAQAHAAALGVELQWGPLARLSGNAQRSLIAKLTRGEQLLLRADLPAQHLSGDDIDRRAVVEVDGASVSAQVLGPLPRTEGAAQSSGWLLQLEHAPPGLGPGARLAVRLQGSARAAGLLVPGEALVYAAGGAYVYRRESASADSFHYVPVAVKPLSRVGSAWLVEGLRGADQVVVQGAGVLWSLEGIGGFSAAEQEHD
jgi:hypothetical protein